MVANKAENQQARQGMSDTVNDAFALGYGEPVAVSATTGEGFVDLYAAMQPIVDAHRQRLERLYGVGDPEEGEGEGEEGEAGGRPGRPRAGDVLRLQPSAPAPQPPSRPPPPPPPAQAAGP